MNSSCAPPTAPKGVSVEPRSAKAPTKSRPQAILNNWYISSLGSRRRLGSLIRGCVSGREGTRDGDFITFTLPLSIDPTTICCGSILYFGGRHDYLLGKPNEDSDRTKAVETAFCRYKKARDAAIKLQSVCRRWKVIRQEEANVILNL